MSEWLENHLPKVVLAPSFITVLIFVYGFIGWTAWVSLTRSKLLPKYEIKGFIQYERLFDSPRWDTAINNLYIFGALFIVIAMVLGLLLAILLDQKIRVERGDPHDLPVSHGAIDDRDLAPHGSGF